jgi:predicted kinase
LNDASKQNLIIVTGHPASGKTTLAQKLEAELNIPLIYRDQIKEILYDSLGWSDLSWSRKLGLASYELLYYIVDTHLSSGNSIIIESNFDPQMTNDRISALKAKYDCRLIQVYCHAPAEVLLARYARRGDTSERHPGHFGREFIDEYKERTEQFPKILLDTEFILHYDTSTFEESREHDIIQEIVGIIV